jgi:aminoglycoside 2'-N-acetyltransferase I
VPTLTLAHTGQLDQRALASVRALLDDAFGGNFPDDDWEHALGGMHVLSFSGERLVAHGSVVQRRMVHGGRALRVGYVEAVGVHPDHRRRGHASAVMDALEDLIRRAYEAGALSASDEGAELYAVRGWQRWHGTTWALTPDGRVRTPDEEGGLFVLPVSGPLDLTGEITCDFRDGDLW